jgi:hypothetical protein
MSQTLPARADLAQLRHQAKDLRKAVIGGNPAALARAAAARDGHVVDRAAFTLRDAQLVVAREYGYAGWHALVSAVGNRQVAERDLHRWFAVELNNEAWDLIDEITPESPRADRERLLYGAYAAACHWLEAGNEANQARAEHLIGWAALVVGLPDVAIRHAGRCAELVGAYPELMADWDLTFSAELLARAHAAVGDTRAAAEHLARARRLADAVTDPADREIVADRLARGPWFGLA